MFTLLDGEKFEDYYFQFNQKENVGNMDLDTSVGYLTGKTNEFFNNSNIINLKLDLFKDDALIFDGLKSNLITLKSNKNNKELTMDFTGFPYLALWTKPTGAPFICIEPWYGHSDYKDFNGEFKDREGIEKLSINGKFNAEYKLFIK